MSQLKIILPQNLIKRNMWAFVNIAFNSVDKERLKEVGPDRLCAEWILKNGGAVRFINKSVKLVDYNHLPPDGTRLKLKEIDATNACIMKIGFEHLKNCEYIDRIILRHCEYLENDLTGLAYVRDSLKFLEVSSCNNIRDNGLRPIANLKKLENLELHNLNFVKNMDKVITELREYLPNCCINCDQQEKYDDQSGHQ